MKLFRSLLALFLLFSSVLISQTTEVVFLQMNDVYEIAPIQGGMFGGLARVSTIKQKLLGETPYTYMILSGDFISPSALSTSEYNGEKINGAQMVDVLNTIGLDFCTFGNHEFDYKKEVLQKRMDESKFIWISGNVKTNKGDALWKFGKNINGEFQGLPEYYIIRIPNMVGGREIRIGILAICIDANKQPYVVYEDYYKSARRVYNIIKDSIDCLVAMTHLAVEQDRELARQMPEIQLIMGGHEHQNNLEKIGETEIAKADANAKTVYIHRLYFDSGNKLASLKSDLVSIDGSVAEDPKTKELVNTWVERAYAGFRKNGFEPEKTVTVLNEPFDGRDEFIRTQPTNLAQLIANAMLKACKSSDFAIFNGGSVRLDDELSGEVSQYDIIRTLPFGGKIFEVELKGSLLKKLLDAGLKNTGSGGYLQYTTNIQLDKNNEFTVNGKSIDPDAVYRTGVASYLLTGLEANMSFFTKDNPDIIKIIEPDPNDKNDLKNDVRLALIKYMEAGGK